MDAEPEGLAISIMLRASLTVRFVINVKRPPPSAMKLICDCRSSCGEDRAFENDGEATIWFEPVDCPKQERSGEDDRRGVDES
jgi:hypothetical protein